MRIAILSIGGIFRGLYRTDGVSCTANTEYLTTATASVLDFFIVIVRDVLARLTSVT